MTFLKLAQKLGHRWTLGLCALVFMTAVSPAYADETRKEVEDYLAKYPVFTNLKTNEPQNYSTVVDSLAMVRGYGVALEQVPDVSTSYLNSLVKPHFAYASDADLVNLYRVKLEQVLEVRKVNPVLCILMLGHASDPAATIPQVGAKMPADYVDRRFAAYDAVFTAKEGGASAVSADAAKAGASISTVTEELSKTFSAEDLLLINETQVALDKEQIVCDAKSEFFVKITELPEDEGANVLRQIGPLSAF